jgi:hypothetical protein
VYSYRIRWGESLDLRLPVLRSIVYSVGPLLSDDRSFLLLENPLESYRQHEITLIKFVLDPEDFADGIFALIDCGQKHDLATALMNLYALPKQSESDAQHK